MAPQTFVTIFCYKCNKICNKFLTFFVTNGNKSQVNDPLDVIPRNGEYEAENVKTHGDLADSDHETEKNSRTEGRKEISRNEMSLHSTYS